MVNSNDVVKSDFDRMTDFLNKPADSCCKDKETDNALPDGGYGWIIIFASFMCHFISDGITYSFGFLYIELLEQFGESKAKTAWVGSLFIGVPLLCAPIAGFFVNKYGCRPATLFGAGLTSAALAVSSFATSIDMLCVTYGVAAGAGLAFIYVPSTVIPSFWFEKKRALATGIAVSGSGVGTFVMAPLIEYLIKEFNWRGALLIISGIAMHMLIFGILFRKRVSKCASEKLKTNPELQQKNGVYGLCTSELSRDKTDMQHDVDDEKKRNLFQPKIKTQAFDLCQAHQEASSKCRCKSAPSPRMNIFSVHTLFEERERILNSSDITEVQVTPRNDDVFVRQQRRKILWRIIYQVKKKCGLTLLAVPVYLLYFMSSFLLAFAYDYPYVYLPEYAKQLDIAKAPFLISIIGIVSTIGQVVYGFIGDFKKVNVVALYSGSSTMCGVALLLVPSMNSYGWLASFSALFGFFISANYALETVVVINILSLDELTKAYSLLLFGQGVASLIGPPVGGVLYDSTKSYSATFYLAGTVTVVSGILAILILIVKKRRMLSYQNF